MPFKLFAWGSAKHYWSLYGLCKNTTYRFEYREWDLRAGALIDLNFSLILKENYYDIRRSALDIFTGPFWSLLDVVTLDFVVLKRDV